MVQVKDTPDIPRTVQMVNEIARDLVALHTNLCALHQTMTAWQNQPFNPVLHTRH